MPEDMTTRMADADRLRALMVAYQAGDIDAFEGLYALLAPQMARWLRSQAGDPSHVDDLVQETFLQMHRARHTYDPSYPVAPWAFAICRHVWLMYRRARSRRPETSVAIDPERFPVRADADTYVERADVWEALAGLPGAQRKPLVWHHVFGLSFREIAARLGIRESAAKLRSSRGMADLRRRLRDDRNDNDDR